MPFKLGCKFFVKIGYYYFIAFQFNIGRHYFFNFFHVI